MTDLGPDDEETPPNLARVFDHYLGGDDNTVVDREFAAEVDQVLPAMGDLCRGHRRFSAAVVDHWCAEGIDQFLELGAGLPTVDHVHTRARRVHPGARVAYVDYDPVAVVHARRVVARHEGVSVLLADAGDAETVLAAPEVRDLLDLDPAGGRPRRRRPALRARRGRRGGDAPLPRGPRAGERRRDLAPHGRRAARRPHVVDDQPRWLEF